MTDRNNPSEFIKKHMGAKVSKDQEGVVEAIIKGTEIIARQRRVADPLLKAMHLEEFNRVCATTDRHIEWHAPNWVAMDRRAYEKLVAAANRNNIKIMVIDARIDELDHCTTNRIGDEWPEIRVIQKVAGGWIDVSKQKRIEELQTQKAKLEGENRE